MENKKELSECSNQIPVTKMDLTSWQLNTLLTIIEKLQDKIDFSINWQEISREEIAKRFDLNKNFNFMIKLKLSEVDKYRHGVQVLNEIKRMKQKEVTYELHHIDGKIYRMSTSIIGEQGTNDDGDILIGIPVSGLRWMMERTKFGRDGRMIINTMEAKILNGTYAKRVYMDLSANYRNGYFRKNIKELMNEYCTPNYSVQDFEKRILKPAFYEMQLKQTQLLFKYRLRTLHPSKSRGRKGYDTVEFKIYDRTKRGVIEKFNSDNWENEFKK